MQRPLALVLLMALAAPLTSACHHGRYAKAPYARGESPQLETLMAATAARYQSLRVPKAKIREGRSPGARLMLLAEAPARMLGTIQVAGNPLLTLALHEQAYGLRSVRDAPGLPPGYYHGPPSRCAVASLLGVDMDPAQVVALLLGGGPLLEGPYELVEQGWHKGRERVVIRNERFEQRLDFAWVDGSWWFAGARLDARRGDATQWLWSIDHESLERRGGSVLPTKTRIRRPGGKRGSVEMTITYAEQVVGAATASGEGGEDGADDGGDEGGWEDEGWDDEGWDDEGEAAASAPSEAAPPAIPPQYQLEANGLPDRGDLCRRGG